MSQTAGKQSRVEAAAPQRSSLAIQYASGRRTLVEQAYGSAEAVAPAVQRKGGGDGGGVHAHAEAGVAGPGGQLPFLDLIQRSFGGHDVGGVRAHTGGAAAAANEAMGSTAYARGGDVAFGGAPDLHTAAHEAAHVVQQRAGVQLKGGVGEAGDAYERHADAVADTVVAGGSSEALLSQMAGPAFGGGGAGAGAVQHQRRGLDGSVDSDPVSDVGTGGATPASSGTAPSGPASSGTGGPPTPLQRVQALSAETQLPALIALQHELLEQLRTLLNAAARPARGGRHAAPASAAPASGAAPATGAAAPAAPDEPALRDGLAEARHRIMDRVAAIRATYADRIRAAQTSGAAPASSGDGAGATGEAAARGAAGEAPGAASSAAVEALETSMDTACAPYLDALMQGDPQNRYSHTNNAVSEEVFAAVRLHSARRGVGRIGHRAEAEEEARRRGGVPTDAWCGAFAYTQAEQGGGMDRHWVSYMAGEEGIRQALEYRGVMRHTWIWVRDHWELLENHHRLRNSARRYLPITNRPPSQGIQPGDLVLIDNDFGTNPDHITTAVSFDGRYLTTVGGNQGSGEAGVSRSGAPIDLHANPAENDIRATENGERVRRRDPRLGAKHVRVHGIGRWSIADYEEHIYSTADTMPTAPPSPAALARISR